MSCPLVVVVCLSVVCAHLSVCICLSLAADQGKIVRKVLPEPCIGHQDVGCKKERYLESLYERSEGFVIVSCLTSYSAVRPSAAVGLAPDGRLHGVFPACTVEPAYRPKRASTPKSKGFSCESFQRPLGRYMYMDRSSCAVSLFGTVLMLVSKHSRQTITRYFCSHICKNDLVYRKEKDKPFISPDRPSLSSFQPTS